MERLTERDANYCEKFCTSEIAYKICNKIPTLCPDAERYYKLMKYEDAEENGRMMMEPIIRELITKTIEDIEELVIKTVEKVIADDGK